MCSFTFGNRGLLTTMDSIQPVESNDEIRSGQVELESSSSGVKRLSNWKSEKRQPRTHMFTGNWELGTSSYPYKLQS